MSINSQNQHLVIPELVKHGHTIVQGIAGTSMMPQIMDGWELRMKRVEPKDLKKGDVITFVRADNNYVVHRVISNDGATIVTRGDSCLRDDKPVSYDKVFGIVTDVIVWDRAFSIRWFGAKIYGRLVIALFPLSGRFNKFLAKMYTKIKHK